MYHCLISKSFLGLRYALLFSIPLKIYQQIFLLHCKYWILLHCYIVKQTFSEKKNPVPTVAITFTCIGKMIEMFASFRDFLISNTYSNGMQFIDYVVLLLSRAVNR